MNRGRKSPFRANRHKPSLDIVRKGMVGYIVIVSTREIPNPIPSAFQGEDGFRGASFWESVGEDANAVAMLHFDDRHASEDHLRKVVESVPDSEPTEFRVPASVHHLALSRRNGTVLEGQPIGSYLTVAHAVADPGFGDIARQDLEDTMEGMAMVDEYAGHADGVNVAMEDEVWGLTFWNSPPILATGVDQRTTFSHYRRVA